MVEEWLEYLPYKRPMLRVLEELSSIHSRGEKFVIIGGFSLLINGYLKFHCLWDVDVLVPSVKDLRRILDLAGLETVIAGELSEESFNAITSVVRAEDQWITLDVLTKDLFPLYERTKLVLEKEVEGYKLRLPVGHPHAVLIDKVLTSRFGDALEREDPLVYDARHVAAILSKDAEKEEFWNFLNENLGDLRDEFFKRLRLFTELSGLGYMDRELKGKVLKRLSKMS